MTPSPYPSLASQLELYHKEIIDKARKSIDFPPPEQRLNPVKVLEDKAALEAEQGLQSLQNFINKGLNALFTALQEQNQEEKIQKMMSWFEIHENQIADLLQKGEKAFSHQNDDSIERQLGFPKDFLETMYQACTYHFLKENYEDALSVILICLLFNGTIYEFWLTFGNILQKKEDMEGALYGYQIASLFKENDPKLYINMALAWISLKNWDSAEQALNKALEICQTGEDAELDAYCHTLKDWLDRRNK